MSIIKKTHRVNGSQRSYHVSNKEVDIDTLYKIIQELNDLILPLIAKLEETNNTIKKG